MKTNKKQIKDLELWEVDYMVAKAEGLEAIILSNICWIVEPGLNEIYSPTTNPSQAWPIIEREFIDINYYSDDKEWIATSGNSNYIVSNGKTSLEAAMRCYVASVYGDEVEL